MGDKQERKAWWVVAWGGATMVYEGKGDQRAGKFICECDAFGLDDLTEVAGDTSGNPYQIAEQIANDHNRVQELDGVLSGLVEAANNARFSGAPAITRLYSLIESIEQARLLLPKHAPDIDTSASSAL